MTRMTGVIFSDLGLASSFMALDWVQSALKECLGFAPFPATLNVRPKAPADAEIWRCKRIESKGVPLASARGGFCSARLYPIEVARGVADGGNKVAGAILVPEVKDYPSDKIEIVAPMRLKDHLSVGDGDVLTLEFLN
jgi:CTP-dependent riboflavin kinase